MPATQLVLMASALYAVVAVLCFGLLNAPFAGIQHRPESLIAVAAFVLPYAVLLLVTTIAATERMRTSVAVVSLVAPVLGASIYFGAFYPNDGEFGLVFLLVPMAQSVLAVPVTLIALWKHRCQSKDTK